MMIIVLDKIIDNGVDYYEFYLFRTVGHSVDDTSLTYSLST